jgi:transposase
MDNASVERIRNTIVFLDERQKRLYLANEAKAIGYGGISQVGKVSGISRVTITQGMAEINSDEYKPEVRRRCRKKGGGRKPIEEKMPDIKSELEELLGPHTKGDPMKPLKWSSKSVRAIEKALLEKGYEVSYVTVAEMLKKQGYSLQTNKKNLAVKPSHPDGNAQFEHINKTASEYMALGEPVISIDAKKKENIGNFKNTGVEYGRKHEPVEVLVSISQ